MRRSKPMKIGDLWAGYVEESPLLTRRLCEARIPEAWGRVAGQTAASFTSSIDIKNGVLYVRISSPVVRHDVFMRREELRRKLNEDLGMAVVGTVIVK